MTAQPLTHHEIFTLVEPFTRRERHVDLAASDRIERRLLFKPFSYPAGASEAAGLVETLRLESPKPGRYRLMRLLRHPSGLEASLEIEGQDPGRLLEQIESIPPERHFKTRPSFSIARSYRLEPTAADQMPASAAPGQLILLHAKARVEGLTLALKAQTGRGMPAEIELHAEQGDIGELPEDLLAVVGWDWRRLVAYKQGWRSTLRLRGREPTRSRDAEVKLTRTLEHLAETLAAPPTRYHERLLRARWAVVFRRAIPLLVGIGLILITPAVQFLELSEGSLIRMLIFHSPPILLIVLFTMREMPRIEIPPFPKPLTAQSWRRSTPADTSATTP